jgi:hypothetical protein
MASGCTSSTGLCFPYTNTRRPSFLVTFCSCRCRVGVAEENPLERADNISARRPFSTTNPSQRFPLRKHQTHLFQHSLLECQAGLVDFSRNLTYPRVGSKTNDLGQHSVPVSDDTGQRVRSRMIGPLIRASSKRTGEATGPGGLDSLPAPTPIKSPRVGRSQMGILSQCLMSRIVGSKMHDG